MKNGDEVITPQGTLVRIEREVDGDYWPADPGSGMAAGGYIVFKCSDGNFYDDAELTPVEFAS